MSVNCSGDKDIYILVFFAGILSALLLVLFILRPGSNEGENNDFATSQVAEITQLANKTQRFSVNGYNIKTATVCFEGKQMLFVFYRGEPQIINLNKDCGETK